MRISVVFARALVSELLRRRLEPDALLELVGERRIASAGEMLSMREASQLAIMSEQASNDLNVVLSAATSAPSVLHPISILMLAQSTQREAIELLTNYSSLLVEGVVILLGQDGDLARLSFQPSLSSAGRTAFFSEFWLGYSARILADMRPRNPLRVARFRRNEPARAELYREVFECPVLFGQSVDALEFSAEALDKSLFHPDRELDKSLRYALDQLMRQTRSTCSWAERVGLLLLHAPQLVFAPPAVVAKRLRVSQRTLRRHLGREGSSLTKITAQACNRMAQEHLRGQMAQSEIARVLHFSDTTAFSRAFRRWNGETPNTYRTQARADSR